MTGEVVFQFIVEQWAHGSPYIAGTNGEFGNLYGLGFGIVDAGTVELIAHGASRK
jgi:hypothetical protein